MPKALKKIALFACKSDSAITEVLRNIAELLKDYPLIWESKTAALAKMKPKRTVSYDQLGKNCDLILVVGGDGSILHSSRSATKYQTPVIGINKGSLGFLADVRPNELETRLIKLLSGEYWEEKRFLLDASIKTSKTNQNCGTALNDIVLSTSNGPHMIDFEIYVGKKFLCSHQADGLLVATPTGSTAYNLSAGGPIIQPNIDAIVMVPMFSHTLSARPIIIPGDSDIKVKFSIHNKLNAKLSCDATNTVEIKPNTVITIKKAAKKLTLLHPSDYDYYESLRSKLHWGHRLTD